jgi:prepilin-type N-terminal cleavage/methylation domain-containing protein
MNIVSANVQHALESRLQPAKAGTPAMQPNYARPLGRRSPANRPNGFTIAETLVALGILAVAMLLVAQVGVWSLQEYARTFDRQAAQELAANVLETARASPWDALNSEWAASQKLPPGFVNDGWRLAVQVDSDASRPLLKRVSVRVDPRPGQTPPFRAEELVGWFSTRAAPTAGEKR